jgi:hypothetical protein
MVKESETKTTYKYKPNDFSDVLIMSEVMTDFYRSYETYVDEDNLSNKFSAEKALVDLLFTIKHRELEGFLPHPTANEMREYMRGLLDD